MYPYTTHFQTLPGNCNIAYVDEGAGDRTLLFIHGLANYALVWQRNIDELKKSYRCIAIDLPGNGLSDQNEHPFSMHFFADTVNNFIQALALKHVCLVGHSMGGQVAMTTLLNYPDCAEALVLCAPAGFEAFSTFDKALFTSTIHIMDLVSSEEHSLRTTIENSFYGHHKQAENVILELASIMKTYKRSYYRQMVEACIHGMLNEPVLERIHLITQPTLIMFGKNDALIPNKLIHHTTTEQIAEEGAKKIANAALVLINRCGHFLQWEKPEEVNSSILKFLEKRK